MKKILYIVFLLTLLLSCSGSKSLSNTQPSNKTLFSEKVDLQMRGLYIDAQAKKNTGNINEAMILLDQVLEINPKHDAALYDQALILNSNGEYGTAIRKVEAATRINPSNIWYQSLKGDLYTLTNQLDKAEQTYKEIIGLDENNYAYNYQLATVQMRQSKFDEAIASLNQVEKHTGLDEEVVLQKQALFMELNEYEKARQEIFKLIDKNPQEAKYYGVIAEIYAYEGNDDKALEYYSKVEELDPGNAQVQLALYDYYRSRGDGKKATKLIKDAFGNESIDIDTKMEVMFDYYEMTTANPSELSTAYELLDILIKTHPEESKSYAIQGDFFLRDDSLKQARNSFIIASEKDPSKVLIWEQVLQLDTQLKDLNDLEKHSSQAIELFPTHPSFYYYNGMAHSELGDHNAAIESLSSGKELVVNNDNLKVEFYTALASSYHNVNNDMESDKYFDKALIISPDNPFILNNYSYYLSERNVRLDDAIAMSRRANEIKSNNPSFEDTFAWILYRSGQMDEAQLWIEKAMNSGGADAPVILEHYGDILLKRGDTSKAKDMWRKAKEKGGASDELMRKIESN